MSRSTFSCPYCCSDIPLQASVCSHCTRDLVLFKPLALRLQDLSDEVQELKALVQQQSEIWGHMPVQEIGAAALSYAHDHEQPPQSEPAPLAKASSWMALCLSVALTTAAIGLCHWVLLFVYDVRPLFLRLLTILLPVLTGFVCARQSRLGGLWQALAAVAAGVVSVWLMLAITAHLDGVPLWPDNPRDWRETLEYTASITLAFFTGFLIHSLLSRWAREQRQKISLKVLLSRDANGKYKIAEVTHQVQSLVAALAPLVSAGTALYSGLKIFLSN